MTLVGTIINGWEVVADGPYQGFDDRPSMGYHGRFWCRWVTALRGDEVITVRGPDTEASRPDWWRGAYPTVRSMLADR